MNTHATLHLSAPRLRHSRRRASAAGVFERAGSAGRRAIARRPSGFTLLEVVVAIGIFSLVMIGIYAVWSSVMNGSRAGLKAAAAAQRARIAAQAIQEALLTTQMFSANGKYYWFIADTSNEKSGAIEFTARLPASFPGVGRYGDKVVRRVRFLVDDERNLIVSQMPVLVAEDKDYEPYSLQLAKDVTLFMFEFWDDQKKEYVTEWARTNQLPTMVRFALGLGTAGNSATPQDLVTCTVAMPCTAIQPQWQRAPIVPQPPTRPGTGPGGQPPPGGPGMPGPGMPGPGGVPRDPRFR